MNAQSVEESSILGDILRDSRKRAERTEAIEKKDVFRMLHPNTSWASGLAHGEKMGMGTREYELITLK